MDVNVSAKRFFEDFKAISKDEEAIKQYHDNKGFTNYVIKKIHSIIEGYKLKAEQEYYRIDVIGYASHFDDVKANRNVHIEPYAWDLKIAVEHENDDKLWMDEVVKLAHICCDLRVVIGYLPIYKEKPREDEKCLEYIADVMKKHCKCYENLKNNEFMIIIGNSNTKKRDEFFEYKGYVFNPVAEKFELI